MKWISRISGFFLLFVLTAATVTQDYSGTGGREENNQAAEEVKMAHAGDINIAYRIMGQGDPIVLIMGYGSTMDMWDPRLLHSLAAKYRVIIFDNRGTGNTTATPDSFSIDQFANDTAGLMAALGVERYHVLGWSMGSFVAQELAIRYPENVDRLILYAGDCGGREAVMPAAWVLDDLANTSGTPEEAGMRLFNLLFPKEWLSRQPPFYEWFPLPKETSLPENIKRQSEAIAAWPGTFDRLKSIKAPTLLVTGKEDLIVPPENSFILAQRINASWLVQFNGAGHGLMYQYPDRLARIIVDFIELSD
jgi:pimeloyl-ACP methyl ester carboxylesterase